MSQIEFIIDVAKTRICLSEEEEKKLRTRINRTAEVIKEPNTHINDVTGIFPSKGEENMSTSTDKGSPLHSGTSEKIIDKWEFLLGHSLVQRCLTWYCMSPNSSHNPTKISQCTIGMLKHGCLNTWRLQKTWASYKNEQNMIMWLCGASTMQNMNVTTNQQVDMSLCQLMALSLRNLRNKLQ